VKRSLWIAAVAALAAVTVLTDVADAKRLGGGRTLGSQRQSIAPPSASSTPGAATNPVMPANPSVAPRAAPAAPAAAPVPARSGMSRWLGPIAGIAAGLGLAALLSHFGLGEGFASMLLILLLVVGVVFVLRMIFSRRSSAPAYAPAGAAKASWSDQAGELGARSERIEPSISGNAAATAAGAAAAARVPPGFDSASFLRNARLQFRSLQSAWDAADRRTLRDVTTPEMYAEVERDLGSRTAHEPTVVDNVDAELLEVTSEAGQHWASVRFTGMIREDGSATPKAFDETWNLVKPIDGSSGWLLAGIQQNEAAVAH